MDESKTVGAFVALRGDTDAPLTVRVDRLASVSGRLLDAEGKPLAKATIILALELDREKYDNLPAEFFEGQGILVVGMYYVQAWRSYTTRRVTTDDDGRFTVTGLLPGQTYRVEGGYPSGNSSITLTVDRKTVTAPAPGKTEDIGDLRGTRD